jgi:hypothetical protein
VSDIDEYQSTTVPVGEVALKLTVPVPHLDPLVTTGEAGNAFTVVVIALDVAGLLVAQIALDVITTDTTSLLANAELEYIFPLVPTLFPFNFH